MFCGNFLLFVKIENRSEWFLALIFIHPLHCALSIGGKIRNVIIVFFGDDSGSHIESWLSISRWCLRPKLFAVW